MSIDSSDEKNVVTISRSEFEKMYKTMKIKSMAKKLNVSTGAIYRQLDALGIKRVGKHRLIVK